MQIDQPTLRQLIANDQHAAAALAEGRYGDCAIRCCEIAPRVPRSLPLSFMGIIAVYRDNLQLGGEVIAALNTVAYVNPIIGLMVSFMTREAAVDARPDFGDPSIRAALTAPQPHGLGLTPQQAAPLLAAGQQPDTITGRDIELLASEEI
jgi:hypothetical protein